MHAFIYVRTNEQELGMLMPMAMTKLGYGYLSKFFFCELDLVLSPGSNRKARSWRFMTEFPIIISRSQVGGRSTCVTVLERHDTMKGKSQ